MKPVDIREQWWWWRGHIREDDQTFIFLNHHPSFMLNPGSSCAVDIFCRYNFSVVERGLCRIKKIKKKRNGPRPKKILWSQLLSFTYDGHQCKLCACVVWPQCCRRHNWPQHSSSSSRTLLGIKGSAFRWFESLLLDRKQVALWRIRIETLQPKLWYPPRVIPWSIAFFSTQFQKVESCLTAIQIWM